jgi:hypothetical protein
MNKLKNKMMVGTWQNLVIKISVKAKIPETVTANASYGSLVPTC